MAGTVLCAVGGPVARVVFSNPDKRNAMSLQMWDQLAGAISQAVEDTQIRIITLAGEGKQAFVSGSDITGFAESRSTADAARAYNDTVEAALSALANCPKPTLAIIRGYCVGGGVSIAAACDIRVGDDKATFAVPAARLGVGYSAEQISRLQQVVGPANLRDIIFTGRRLGAADALRIGLLSQVIPEAEIAASAEELAGQIAANAPLTIKAAKRASLEALRPAGEREAARLAALLAACFDSDDYREGQKAFTERRKPVFMGR